MTNQDDGCWDAAIVLAGGSGRRLGGIDKPALTLGAATLLDLALAAVTGAPVVVVGPPRDLPAGVLQVRESPSGGGPAAALAAGLRVVADQLPELGPSAVVVVLAADLPGVRSTSVSRLVRGLDEESTGAVLIDAAGRDQYLVGAWKLGPLRSAVAARPDWSGARLSDLLGPLVSTRIRAQGDEVADIDTPADLDRWHRPHDPGQQQQG